jgi:hypothetical protein
MNGCEESSEKWMFSVFILWTPTTTLTFIYRTLFTFYDGWLLEYDSKFDFFFPPFFLRLRLLPQSFGFGKFPLLRYRLEINYLDGLPFLFVSYLLVSLLDPISYWLQALVGIVDVELCWVQFLLKQSYLLPYPMPTRILYLHFHSTAIINVNKFYSCYSLRCNDLCVALKFCGGIT